MRELKAYYRENKIFCILLAALAAAVAVTLLSFNFKGHDYPYHIQRLASIADEIRVKGIGAFPIRVFSANKTGYGYASPLFYGDILMYPFAFLILLGMNAAYAYRIMLLVIYAGCFFGMYYCAKQVSKDVQASLAAAMIYAFSAYFAADVFTRSALGESFAFIFMPFAFYGFYCTVISRHESTGHKLLLVLGMSGLIITHLISTVIVAMTMAVFMIIYYKNWIKKPRIITELILMALMTAALCAFFIFPMLEQMAAVKYRAVTTKLCSFDTYKLSWLSWFVPYELWILPLNVTPWELPWFPGGFGFMLVTLICILIFNRKKLTDKRFIYILCASLGIVLLGQGYIIPFSASEKIFGFMQFPYRLMMVGTFFMSVFGAYAVYTLKSKKINFLLLMVSILSCGIIIITTYHLIKITDPKMNDEYSLTSESIGNGEYIPDSFKNYMADVGGISNKCALRGDRVKTNYYDIQYTHSNNGYGEIIIDFSNNIHTDASFELPLFMYKGYSAVDENTHKKYDVSCSENGLVLVNTGGTPSGRIIVRYTGTIIQHISDIISILTLAAVVLCLLVKAGGSSRAKRRAKRKDNRGAKNEK